MRQRARRHRDLERDVGCTTLFAKLIDPATGAIAMVPISPPPILPDSPLRARSRPPPPRREREDQP